MNLKDILCSRKIHKFKEFCVQYNPGVLHFYKKCTRCNLCNLSYIGFIGNVTEIDDKMKKALEDIKK